LGFAQVKQRQRRSEVLCFAQCEVKCATHARRHFTTRSIASHTEGVLIVPQGTLSSKKHSCNKQHSVKFGFRPSEAAATPL